MAQEANKAIVLRIFEQAFNLGNMAVIDEVIAADAVYHLPDEDICGPAGFHQMVTAMRTAFPDFHVTTESVVAEGDIVVVRFTDRGTHQGDGIGVPPTGKHVTWSGFDMARIADGKIIEGWGMVDVLGLMQQLGVIPASEPAEKPDLVRPGPGC